MYNDELMHWNLRKGEQSKRHKYTFRELIGTKNGQNRYRYFYGKMPNKNNQQKKTAEPPNGNIGFIVPISVNTTDKIRSKIFETVRNAYISTVGETESYKKGKEKTEKMMQNENRPKDVENNKEHKYVGKVEKPDGSYRYFYDEKQLANYYRNHGNEAEKELMDKYGLKDDLANPEQDVDAINDKYETATIVSPYYTSNCYSATLAYDLRRRGFDVDAIPDSNGASMDTILDFYEGSRSDMHTNITPKNSAEYSQEMLTEMKNEGDGARGFLMVYWKTGGGHAMAWEVVGDEVIVRDCQSTNQYYSASSHSETYNADSKSRKKAETMYQYSKYENTYIEDMIDYTAVSEHRGAVTWVRTDNKNIKKSTVDYVRAKK